MNHRFLFYLCSVIGILPDDLSDIFLDGIESQWLRRQYEQCREATELG